MIISKKQLLCLELLRYIILCRRVSPWGRTSIKKRSGQRYIRTNVQQQSEDIPLVDLLLPLVQELSFLYSPINNPQTCSLYFVTGEFYLISTDRNIHVRCITRCNETKQNYMKWGL